MPITLHIFEERYRLMIGRCLEQKAPFGVVLIREGTETSADVTSYFVGTTAQISDGVRLEDGRYYLVATGQRRFRIQYIVQRQPYSIGSVSYLPEESSTTVVEVADQLRSLYTDYWRALAAATGHRQQPETPPEDVIELTYWLAHRLRVDNGHKQRWLEADVATRIREMTAALRSELALLPDSAPNDRERGWKGSGSWN
jgi:Lon protease-like protein